MPDWYVTKDGDLSCLDLYGRHYSCYDYKDGRKRSQFVGPGEHIVLRTGDADAMFVWRKFIDDAEPKQEGVNCAVFRNESCLLSSDLIRQADAVADFCWPGERHYTYVNPKAVRSRNPGFCFVAAGWRKCGMTKGKLWIYERPATQLSLIGSRRGFKMSRERFTAWVTKYALTEGILKMLVEDSEHSPGMVTKVNGTYLTAFHGNDWHRTPEDAIARAEQMRAAKLKSLDKQRARIAALRFAPGEG